MFTSELPKLISGLLYISKKLNEMNINADIHRVFKIMYFADKISLKEYKHIVFGGYSKCPYGPVPQNLYDEIKLVRANPQNSVSFRISDNKFIEPIQDCDMDEFSETDIMSLNQSLSENAKLSFDELSDKSHDAAWNHTATGTAMNLIEIAEASGLNQDSIEYLKEVASNSQLVFD